MGFAAVGIEINSFFGMLDGVTGNATLEMTKGQIEIDRLRGQVLALRRPQRPRVISDDSS